MSDDETRVEAGGAQERPSGERQPPRALRPGDIVAHYRIVGPLGEGGSGAIYEARNIHHEGERVALKIVQPDIADRALFFDLLRAEASALQRVKHEAVVQYRTFGRLPDSDECFLVIEHVSGPTLAAAMRSAKLPEEAVRRLAIRLSDGLDAAHEQGIVHRDLSPDNVIMPDGDPDRATLIDFGIARSAAADPLGSKFAGKLSFAAPEQFADDPAQVGPWSDLYSLGLLLAAAARGRKLDMGSDLATAVALRRRIPNLDGVPPRLHGALAALLQPDPALRVRSASQAAALFAPQPQQSPVTVRDPERNSSPDAVAPQATVRRRRPLLIAAAIAAALGLGDTAMLALRHQQERGERRGRQRPAGKGEPRPDAALRRRGGQSGGVALDLLGIGIADGDLRRLGAFRGRRRSGEEPRRLFGGAHPQGRVGLQ